MKKNENQLTEELFKQFTAQAKYQFLLKTGKYVYFVPIVKGTTYSSESFVAHNETTGSVDIVNYKDIKSVVVDGKETFFDQ